MAAADAAARAQVAAATHPDIIVAPPNEGGFNNVAAVKLRRLGRQARRTGVNRTTTMAMEMLACATLRIRSTSLDAIGFPLAASALSANMRLGA